MLPIRTARSAQHHYGNFSGPYKPTASMTARSEPIPPSLQTHFGLPNNVRSCCVLVTSMTCVAGCETKRYVTQCGAAFRRRSRSVLASLSRSHEKRRLANNPPARFSGVGTRIRNKQQTEDPKVSKTEIPISLPRGGEKRKGGETCRGRKA